MNFCFVNPSKYFRPEIYELSKHLPSQKYNITILQPSSKASLSDGFYLRKNVYVKYVPSRFLILSDLTVTLPSARRWMDTLLNLVRQDQCDLIHACDYEYLSSVIPVLIKRRHRNIPITIVNDAIMGAGDYSFSSFPIRLLSRVYTQTLGMMILRGYDRIIFLYSKSVKEAYSMGLPSQKLEIIPNGIDIQKASHYQNSLDVDKIKKKYGITGSERVILFVGRLVNVKRVEIVVLLVRKLLDLGLKVKALIVGDGPQRARLRAMPRSIGSNILFTGYVSEEEKCECYRIADLFVLPSLSEGLPTVLLEAASFGLPMVATNVGGIPDIIIHGKTGFLANRWNQDEYSKFALRILADEDLATRMGENARRHVENNFSWNVVARKYEMVYEALIG